MIDRAAYDALDRVNWSTLKYAVQSGLAYRHCLTCETSESDAMRLGRAVHAAVFEPDVYAAEFVAFEGRRAGGEWERFKDANCTKTILRADDIATVTAIQAAVHGHEVAASLLAEGLPEHTVTWTDAPTGIDCKARLDWVTQDALVDIKTTRDIEIRAFGANAARMLYHGQLAFYADGLKAQDGRDRRVFIIAVESDPPHDVAVYELDEDVLWAGEVLYRDALRTVKRCREGRCWPGRYPTPVGFVLPAYMHPSEEATDATLAEVEVA